MLILSEHYQYYNKGCHTSVLSESVHAEMLKQQPKPFYFQNNKEALCFEAKYSFNETENIKELHLNSSYYIGLQYIKEWNLPLIIEPKVNENGKRLDFYTMLSEALTDPENFNHLEGLIDIDFKSKWIEVPPKSQIELTPFLIIQFAMAVKQLVKKGLKKSYYRKEQNLRNRVKGKILVGAQVKQNVFKSRLTHTMCSYQEFGFNTPENRFIKHVLRFVYAHLTNYQHIGFKTQLKELLDYNLVAFNQVDEEQFKSFTKKETNPFYNIYNTIFKLGNQILKLISHSFEKSTQEIKIYPPHWIDMSKLFELYVFKKLRETFPGSEEVRYHIKTNRQELDYLINADEFKAVVDAKYKPRYKNGNPSIDDARQTSGYARLKSVYKELSMENSNTLIPIYIVYPKNLEEIINVEPTNEEVVTVNDNTITSILRENEEVRSVMSYKKMFLQQIDLPGL